MSEMLRGKVLIDIARQERAWGQSTLPTHAQVVPYFKIHGSDLHRVTGHLQYELAEIKPFLANVEMDKITDTYVLHSLSIAAFTGLHIATARALERYVSEPFNLLEMGDDYRPIVEVQETGPPITSDVIAVSEVMLALEMPMRNHSAMWHRTPMHLGGTL